MVFKYNLSFANTPRLRPARLCSAKRLRGYRSFSGCSAPASQRANEVGTIANGAGRHRCPVAWPGCPRPPLLDAFSHTERLLSQTFSPLLKTARSFPYRSVFAVLQASTKIPVACKSKSLPPCLQACGSARPADRPRLSLFWSRPRPGARSSRGRRSSEETRPGRAVSFCCSVHLAHPSHALGQVTRPGPPHMPSAKSQSPAPLAVAGTSAPQGEMRWGGGRERLFPVDDLVSFHGTNENRGVFSSPIASPTPASVRLGHGPLCRDEGPSPRSAPRAPLPRLSPGAAPRRDFPALRGQRHQQTRCVPPTPRHGPPLASQPPPGTTPICCSSQQNSSERMLRVSSDYLTAQFRPSFHPPLRPPTTATSSTPGTLSIPPLA